MTPRRAGVAATALLLAVAFGACSGNGRSRARTIRVEMRLSKFIPADLTVEAGTTVTFALVNEDPIAHEFIIGDKAEQDRHELSSDENHDGAPGAASLEAGETDRVTVTLERPGQLLYACHRPGHYAYGMVGSLLVT